jgi:amino acid permease
LKKQFNAICTIIAGTIGVGFLALPYAIYHFGTIWGIGVLFIAGFLTLITNLTYSDIITIDKGNRQIPGYTKKYLGKIPAHIITIIMITGLFGILLAYAMLAGDALEILLSLFKIKLSSNLLGLIFVVISLFVMRYGVKFVAKLSTLVVIIMIFTIILLVGMNLSSMSLSNVTPIDLKYFSLILGVSIFSLYSTSSIPMVDEVIGYSSNIYRRVIIISSFITILVYIIFGLVFSLSLGGDATSSLVGSFENPTISVYMSFVILLAIFSSFVIVANNVKEILCYDYKVSSKIALFLISSVLIWFVILEFGSFESIISIVGSFSLALQSITIFAIWFRLRGKVHMVYRIIVGLCGGILILGMLL